MNKKNLTIALALLGVAAKTFAAVENANSGIVPNAFLVGPPPSGGVNTIPATLINLVVPKFSGAGTLLSVAYTLDVYTYSVYNVTNNNSDPTSHTVTWGLDANSSLKLPDLTFVSGATPLFALPLGNLNAGANSAGTTASQLFTTASAAAGPLALYQGAGNVTFVFSPNSVSGVIGSTGNSNPSVFAAARVNVVYTYTNEIPEPSTYAAGAVVLAGAGLVLRRRMQAAK